MADEECFAGGVHDLGGEGIEAVDGLEAMDLAQDAIDEAEVALGDPHDGGHGGGVGDGITMGCGRDPACEDDGEFLGGEVAVFVGEADTAVELGVAGQALFDAGHADEDDAHGVTVVVVTDLFQTLC